MIYFSRHAGIPHARRVVRTVDSGWSAVRIGGAGISTFSLVYSFLVYFLCVFLLAPIHHASNSDCGPRLASSQGNRVLDGSGAHR